MPEFEENNQINKADDKYTPSTDAKPRSRRRSGGFKSDYVTNTSLNIGEVDPSLALKEDTLKKATETTSANPASNQKEAHNEPQNDKKIMAKRTPLSQETLRVIQEMEEKIAEKKLAREAHQKDKKPRKAKTKKKIGFGASILNGIKAIFGIKPKKKAPYRRKGHRPNYKKKRYPRKKA